MAATASYDVAVIGGGILGTAVARELLLRRPGLNLVVLEREEELAFHQTGHNSGVVHAGIYYAPGSDKARLCAEGKRLLEAYCGERGIPIGHPGKLVIAHREDEIPQLEAIEARARANGVPGLEMIGPERIRELEPRAVGRRALWSPTTGIVDFRRVTLAFAADVQAAGGAIRTGAPVTRIEPHGGAISLGIREDEVSARSVIACAGLWSDRVAALTGDAGSERIVPFRGSYYELVPGRRALVQRLLYPVPDPRFPFLGVHLTPRVDGRVWVGPNAVLALARTGYRRRDVDLRELAGIVRHAGFRRLIWRHWRTGIAEQWRDLSRHAFADAARRFIPEIRDRDLVSGPSGIRAQALDPDGSLVEDFRLGGNGRILHVRNAPSPAATSSLAIARELADRAERQLLA